MAAVFAIGMGSCAYDPNYMAGGYYGASYGEGYGYGYSGFSTSMFVSTGDPRWGYDPYCHSYYDYTRRCYYDPYLYGYYPIGYRPVVVVGVPHPHGYSHSYCPPPTRVRSITLVNYNRRADAYRSSGYSWAGQVRQGGGNYVTQPKYKPVTKPYSQGGNIKYGGNNFSGNPPGGYPQAYKGGTFNKTGGYPALHGQSGVPANYGMSGQGNPSQTMKGKYNSANAYQPKFNPNNTYQPKPNPNNTYQGGSHLKPGGGMPQPQVQASPPAPKVRGLGQAKEGKEGKEGKDGWGGSHR